jgi:adenylate cyclase, class 2
MAAGGHETEAKFYVRDLDRIKLHLVELEAHLTAERVLETNLRFDLPGSPLRAEGRVLRLRRDTEARLTYKSASDNEQGVLSREEIEFVVEDFEKAKQFLEALGYQKLVYYEKYRTTYELDGMLIMLDELPYGNFVEIEGETIESIQLTADKLNLDWGTAIATSYTALFERARNNLKLSIQDLSFAEFANVRVDAAYLGVQAADV